MPKRTIEDDEMPRRRRGAKAVAVNAEEERGFVMRMLLRSPKDMLAGALAVAAIGAILTNALFLQAGRHPSPMFGSVVKLPAPAPAVANPLPRPRPVELVRSAEPPEPKPVESRNADSKTTDPKSADPKTSDAKTSDAKTSDPMTNLVVRSTGSAPAAAASSITLPAAKAAGSAPATTAHVVRPPAPIPASAQSAGARRVASVQRALTEYGYGQLKPTGAVGSDTQAAITKFERDRKLPVTGQMSDRLVKELTAMTGRPIE
ncbi:peptidoglycan-binding domain-containing protein [Bradyrhizobium sp. JYMT SZCCT0428]|uniref:peptidoglycan-binding domain-containing protein n=1 Tax=Bradyrhizobium sp. JYMT SZCCT0428 TaxID=2807673 RepID=UPI001BA912DA|nr:peptidoglycan-binding domain-containing protein [Bradyrhizobium sp. JYMT SZCCT0428]MBR1151216.1 peptidoglycan-binding protein [Bradyrhizobium sp. JYMT SZCCT0428]